jgi:hypothetical protein
MTTRQALGSASLVTKTLASLYMNGMQTATQTFIFQEEAMALDHINFV